MGWVGISSGFQLFVISQFGILKKKAVLQEKLVLQATLHYKLKISRDYNVLFHEIYTNPSFYSSARSQSSFSFSWNWVCEHLQSMVEALRYLILLIIIKIKDFLKYNINYCVITQFFKFHLTYNLKREANSDEITQLA